MQQFFVNALEAPWLSDAQRRQCQKVLRMRKGDQVRLVNGQGEGVVASFVDDSLETMEIVSTITWQPKTYKTRLIASLIRAERLEWMIQKCCEIGVDEIVLYSARHGVVRDFGKRSERKIERLNMIALEACEQSMRQYVMPVIAPIELQDVGAYLSELNIFADIGKAPHLINVVKPPIKTITAIVGPEGGFASSEVEAFKHLGFEEVSLGASVLRAETASIYIASMISACEVKA